MASHHAADAANAALVDAALQQHWPSARCELRHSNTWELLVAVILSVRAADDRVNAVMATLTEHLGEPARYAALTPGQLERAIRRLPFAAQKARAIVESARSIVARHGGEVPGDLPSLLALPGVGRKVAAVVLGNAFGVPMVAADQHVQRIVARLGWADAENAQRAELALMERLPRARWVQACHQLIRLGREHCRPLRPWCSRCPLSATCPKAGVGERR